MPDDDDRPSAMLASRDERIQSYLRQTRSTEDIVRDVTSGFAKDVARIMAEINDRSPQPGQNRPQARGRARRR